MNGLDYSKFIARRDDGSGMDKALYMAMSLAEARQAMEQRTQQMELTKLRIAEAQRKKEENELFQKDFLDFAKAGKFDAETVSAFMRKHVMFAKSIKELSSALDEQSKKPVGNMISQTLHALSVVDPTDKEGSKKAYEVIQANIDEYASAGNELVKQYAGLLKQGVKIDQVATKNGFVRTMPPVMAGWNMELQGQEEYANTIAKAGQFRRAEELHPYELREARAKTEMAEATAKYAEEQAHASLLKTKADLLRVRRLAAQAGLNPKDVNLHASSQFDSGAVQLVMKNGDVRLVEPDEKTKRAVQESIQVQKQRAGGRRAGVLGAEMGMKVSETISQYRRAMENAREAIRVLDTKEVNWGTVWNWLPSFRDATIALQHLARTGAIDVLNSARLAPVSDFEFGQAMKISMPDRNPKALREWLVGKLQGMQAIMPMLDEQARFMGGGQHSIDEWLDYWGKLQADRKRNTRQQTLRFTEESQSGAGPTTIQPTQQSEIKQREMFKGMY